VSDGARNDLYLCFKEAQFNSNKSRTYEVHLRTLTNGLPVSCIATTSAQPLEDNVALFTIGGQSSFKWEELYCVKLPPEFLKPSNIEKHPLQLVATVYKVESTHFQL